MTNMLPWSFEDLSKLCEKIRVVQSCNNKIVWHRSGSEQVLILRDVPVGQIYPQHRDVALFKIPREFIYLSDEQVRQLIGLWTNVVS